MLTEFNILEVWANKILLFKYNTWAKMTYPNFVDFRDHIKIDLQLVDPKLCKATQQQLFWAPFGELRFSTFEFPFMLTDFNIYSDTFYILKLIVGKFNVFCHSR